MQWLESWQGTSIIVQNMATRLTYLHMIVKCMSMNEWVAFFLMVHALKMRIIIIRSHAACIVFFYLINNSESDLLLCLFEVSAQDYTCIENLNVFCNFFSRRKRLYDFWWGDIEIAFM